MSNMAIAMMKQSETAIFVDFPGHDSFDVVLKTITRGDPDGAQGQFTLGLHVLKPGSSEMHKVQETEVDVKEQFMVYTYRDLLDFVRDFQNTRSGKPTKAMTARIRNWDPYLDLKRATKDQRMQWRRSYTIKWLYDLVNVFSCIVVQRNRLKGENHAYERVDWSTKGPWNEHRRLFGLNEFAGIITTLAMQKPGTDVRKRILPSHVLQLQSIVDSFSICRGWSNSALRGHILKVPPHNFSPRRDLDLFLDRENKRMGHGILNAVNILKQFYDKKSEREPNAHQHERVLLDGIMWEFMNWLGESKYQSGLDAIPPSQFSDTNSNGLWEYSPFLCGVGLMEGLELAYAAGMYLWERIPEPMLVIHLHNMVVQKGFLGKPVGLYATLEQLHPSEFFAEGKIPTSDFNSALLAATGQSSSAFVRRLRDQAVRIASRTSTDLHGILDTKLNRFFKSKTMITSYRLGEWHYERVPEEHIPEATLLARIRIAEMKPVVDGASGKTLFEGNLADRMRAAGLDLETTKTEFLNSLDSEKQDEISQKAMESAIPEGYKLGPSLARSLRAPKIGSPQFGDGDLQASVKTKLDLLKFDILVDVFGELRPLSSLNYVFVTTMFHVFFHTLEGELGRLQNRSFLNIYEGTANHKTKAEKRIMLATVALQGDDEGLLRVLAKVFDESRTGFMSHIYWEDLADSEALFKLMGDSEDHGIDNPGEANCVVM
ncbi:hypothetical protein F4808DRAFT_438147 [Astrocystis sublimbata]|nr:hypothetical protein F4808DRAFT_438140 [Astrocystis sublimbata]KAI0197792.1 hypothetical protein F4808DRAFT_438147 [Astrocystis sublimbata]